MADFPEQRHERPESMEVFVANLGQGHAWRVTENNVILTRGRPLWVERETMEELIDFCNRITPARWNVTADPVGHVFHGPGTLNIFVYALDHFIDGWFYAFKKGSMSFQPVSSYRDRYGDARRSLQKHGEHLVGESEIWLYPDGCRFFGDNLFAATVHELAHVVVDRWLAFKGKAHRSPGFVSRQRGGLHDEVFCKAFEILIRRVDGLQEDWGEILLPLKRELENYRFDQVFSAGLAWG
ncbi:MAG: hypothetical protein JW821_00815 [Deltaproteobacteria bacterium]|nr:hypothetical protein [Deltaproteobacteria bacterium]